MPGKKHLPGATAKEQRMYEHIKDSSGSKAIAAATVNKYRRKKGETKKQR
jgi:hypothetical protein